MSSSEVRSNARDILVSNVYAQLTTMLIIHSSLGPDILLVLITAAHAFHYIFRLLQTHRSLLANKLYQLRVHFACHFCCIATNVEIGLFKLEELIYQIRMLFNSVLHVNFLGLVARESCDELKTIAQYGLKALEGGALALVESYEGRGTQRLTCHSSL